MKFCGNRNGPWLILVGKKKKVLGRMTMGEFKKIDQRLGNQVGSVGRKPEELGHMADVV